MQIPRRHFISGMALAAMRLSLFGQKLILPLNPNSVRFAIIGDMGTGEAPQYDIAGKMNATREIFHFEFVVTVGDNIYGGHSQSDYHNKFELPYKLLLDSGVQFYAALGNHDSPSEKFYKPFNMNGQQYYTFKKGNVQFYALDSNYMETGQLAWIEKELQNSTADWKICYFHHPLYSSAAFHGPSIELRHALEPLFVKHGVQLVLAGHEHVYERTKPQQGITYFTQGSSGELRKGNLRKTDVTAAGFDQDRSFTLVEVSGDELNFQTISRTGATVDSGVFNLTAKGASVMRSGLIIPSYAHLSKQRETCPFPNLLFPKPPSCRTISTPCRP